MVPVLLCESESKPSGSRSSETTAFRTPRLVPDFVIGLDLGQASDPTALAVLRRSLRTPGGMPERDHRGDPLYRFECVHLKRYDLFTPYPKIVADVSALLAKSEVARFRPHLALDATGVGRPVVDMFLTARLRADVRPVTITAGRDGRHGAWPGTDCLAFWTPKLELASSIQAALGSERLDVAGRLPQSGILRKELLGFRARITTSGNETCAAREGEHDDLVLALALALWLGSHPFCEFRPGSLTTDARALDDESRAERAAVVRKREADAVAGLNRRSAGLALAFSWGRFGA